MSNNNYNNRATTALPTVDSVHEGRVVRIEPYGAFVQFAQQWRGLVHISELSTQRVEHVTDVVEMDEHVWVKVLQVDEPPQQTATTSNNEQGGRRLFPKIKLSLKGVPQDGTAPDVMAATQQAQQAKMALQQNLNSTVGIAIASDPMHGMLVLKQDQKPKLIHGYALLPDDDDDDDDDENEKEQPAPSTAPAPPVAPMGRGRGLTMPAWMTQPKSSEGLTKKGENRKEKKKKAKKQHRRERKKDDDGSSVERPRKRHKKKKKRRHYYTSDDDDDDGDDDESSRQDRSRRRRRHRRHYSDDDSDVDYRRHRTRRSRKRYSDDDGDDDSRSERHRRRHRRSPSSHQDDSSGGDGPDRRRSRDDGNDPKFTSIEQAKKMVREIEARRRDERS